MPITAGHPKDEPDVQIIENYKGDRAVERLRQSPAGLHQGRRTGENCQESQVC